MGNGLAVFDLDRTLVPGSSLAPFGRELVRRGLLARHSVARHLATAAVFRRRNVGDATVGHTRDRLLGLLADRDHGALADAARDVGSAVAADAYPSARWLLDRHLAQGDFCVLLTAAPQELAEAVAHALGAHRAVGTRVEVDGGTCTGRLQGEFCHGAGKLVRIREDLGEIDWAAVTAYGDSTSDLPVLERSANPVATNPDRRLTSIATSRGWPVLRLR